MHINNDRWAEMEKSRLYVFYGICNCIISYYVLETIIDTERYVERYVDTERSAKVEARDGVTQ